MAKARPSPTALELKKENERLREQLASICKAWYAYLDTGTEDDAEFEALGDAIELADLSLKK